MEEVKIYFKKEVLQTFNDLVFDLFLKDYFSSLESSITYKDKIITFIKNSISTFPSIKSPKKLKQFGNQYIFYKSSNRTTWYIFFEKQENEYLITKIINNHSSFANEI